MAYGVNRWSLATVRVDLFEHAPLVCLSTVRPLEAECALKPEHRHVLRRLPGYWYRVAVTCPDATTDELFVYDEEG